MDGAKFRLMRYQKTIRGQAPINLPFLSPQFGTRPLIPSVPLYPLVFREAPSLIPSS